jgi:hypothetical protein
MSRICQPRRKRPGADRAAIFLLRDPFRVMVGGVLIALDADVDGCTNPVGVQGIDLLP